MLMVGNCPVCFLTLALNGKVGACFADRHLEVFSGDYIAEIDPVGSRGSNIVSSGRMVLKNDNTVLDGSVGNQPLIVQKYFDKLVKWADNWQMNFNAEKCKRRLKGDHIEVFKIMNNLDREKKIILLPQV
eukprot:g35730.t1